MNKELNVYMGFDSALGSEEWAVLIFATDAKEARKIGWRKAKEHIFVIHWTDMSVRRLKSNLTMLKRDADQEKLAKGIPHAIIDMTVCPTCGLWGENGMDETGSCGYCESYQ